MSGGLGGCEKKKEVHMLVNEKLPFVLCIQESKPGSVDDMVVKYLWGDSPSAYSYQRSIGASGGLLTVWDCNVVDVWSSMSLEHMLVIKGTVISSGQEFVIVNVYAPCDMGAKQILW